MYFSIVVRICNSSEAIEPFWTGTGTLDLMYYQPRPSLAPMEDLSFPGWCLFKSFIKLPQCPPGPGAQNGNIKHLSNNRYTILIANGYMTHEPIRIDPMIESKSQQQVDPITRYNERRILNKFEISYELAQSQKYYAFLLGSSGYTIIVDSIR